MSDNTLNPEFYDILDLCVGAVLSGTQTVEDCLIRYPQYAELLKPDLQIALLTARLKSPRLSAAKVDALEEKLFGKIIAAPVNGGKPVTPTNVIPLRPAQTRVSAASTRFLSRTAAVLLIVFLIALGSGGGLVRASADDMPGESLYGIKRLWESVIVLVATIAGNLDDVWLQLAETRLDELVALGEQGELTESAVNDMQKATLNAVAYASPVNTAALVTYLESAQTALESPTLIWADSSWHDALLSVIQPALEANRLESPLVVPPTPTLTSPTFTPESTATATMILSATPLNVIVPTETVVPPTATLLIPATPTRTPTPTVTVTATPQATLTLIPTFTPLPPMTLPGLPPVTLLPQLTALPGGNGSLPLNPTPYPSWYPYTRLTEEAFYLTRTAVPLPTVDSTTP